MEVSPPEPWGQRERRGGGPIRRGGVSVIDTARPASPPQSHQQYKTRPNVDIITGNFADVDLHETFSIKTHTQDKPQTDQVPLKRRFWIAPFSISLPAQAHVGTPPPLHGRFTHQWEHLTPEGVLSTAFQFPFAPRLH